MLGWYNNSVKNYTSVVEAKLLKLVEDCLEQQELLERRLKEYESTSIEKISVITIEKDKEMQDVQGDSACCSNEPCDYFKKQKRKRVFDKRYSIFFKKTNFLRILKLTHAQCTAHDSNELNNTDKFNSDFV